MVVFGQAMQIVDLFGVQIPLLYDARIFSLKVQLVALRTDGLIVTSIFVPRLPGSSSPILSIFTPAANACPSSVGQLQ